MVPRLHVVRLPEVQLVGTPMDETCQECPMEARRRLVFGLVVVQMGVNPTSCIQCLHFIHYFRFIQMVPQEQSGTVRVLKGDWMRVDVFQM